MTDLSRFLDGVEHNVAPDWHLGIITEDGTVHHRGEEITEQELHRRWEESGPHGPDELKGVDFRAHGPKHDG